MLVHTRISKRKLSTVVSISTQNSFPKSVLMPSNLLLSDEALSPSSIVRYSIIFSLQHLIFTVLHVSLSLKKYVLSSDQFAARSSSLKILGCFIGGSTDDTNIQSPFLLYNVSSESGEAHINDIFNRVKMICNLLCSKLGQAQISEIETGILSSTGMTQGFPTTSNFADRLLASFMFHFDAWTADSHSSEKKAANVFSEVRKHYCSKYLGLEVEDIPHLHDPAHILRNAIQRSNTSLNLLKTLPPRRVFADPDMNIPEDLVLSNRTLKKVSINSFFQREELSEEFKDLLNLQSTFTLYTIVANQVLGLPDNGRYPPELTKPPRSRQMSFDQGLLVFRLFVKNIRYYRQLLPKLDNNLSAVIKLKKFLGNKGFIDSLSEMIPFLDQMVLFLSVVMSSNAVSLGTALESLKQLFSSPTTSSLDVLRAELGIIDEKMKALKSMHSNSIKISSASTLDSSIGHLRVSFKQGITSVCDDECMCYAKTFKYVFALNLIKYISSIEVLLLKNPSYASLICSTIDLERHYGFYKVLESQNELGSSILTKIVGGYIVNDGVFPYDDSASFSFLQHINITGTECDSNMTPKGIVLTKI